MATPNEASARRALKDPTLEAETELFAGGSTLVIGVDEVGRGAIAGPVAVGVHATTVGVRSFPDGLRDSKLLSEKRREALAPQVALWGPGAVGYAGADEIDACGIVWALALAACRALKALETDGVPVSEAVILLDGSHDWLTPALSDSGEPRAAMVTPPRLDRGALTIQTMVGGDRSCASIAAASIRAKVERDALMKAAHEEYPSYSWNTNKGYGAQAHYAGITSHGLTSLHRRSFIRTEK